MTEEKMTWDGESHGGELFAWDKVGKEAVGVLIGKRLVNTKLGEMTVYDIETKEGEIAVPGTKLLNDTMRRYPANGTLVVKIKFEEEKKGKYPNPAKIFSVKYAKADAVRLEALGIKMFEEDVDAKAISDFNAQP